MTNLTDRGNASVKIARSAHAALCTLTSSKSERLAMATLAQTHNKPARLFGTLMTLYLSPAAFFVPKLQAANTNHPPAPPSPFDEIERNRQCVKDRTHFLKLMKERFPGLPY
ncbi:hypothetical protein [Castellaniella sp.]|uniref:hypothetical protein n=1 Tax=Castellaniella sp. TaxID=1955812 RepID=UPI003C72C0DE